MDFSISDDFADQRAAAERWVDRHYVPEWIDRQRATGTHHEPELHALMARDGVLGAGFPTAYGGTNVGIAYKEALVGALAAKGILLDGWGATEIVLRVILEVATDEQKAAIVPEALAGGIIIALGYSEPDAGSDVAAAKTRADRDGDGWVINGQKAFTSTAQASTHVFVLARTNPDVPKHDGLTMFLVPLDAPGVELQPIYTLGGQRTNFTYFDDVRVPDSVRIGDIDGGWPVMRVALVYERNGTNGKGQGQQTLSRRVAAVLQADSDGFDSRYFAEPTIPGRLARMAIDEEVTKLLGLRVAWMHELGEVPGIEGSMAKLFGTESTKRHHGEVLDMLGPQGLLQHGVSDAPLDGDFEREFRESIVDTIKGGASEVLRDIIAERRLGLPRSRPPTRSS